MKMTRILPALAAVAAGLLLVLAATAYLWRSDAPQPFMIATANPYATEAGASILRAGGSATDAAIAVQAVLSLVEPESSGLAGGAFMMHFDPASGAVEAYDGR